MPPRFIVLEALDGVGKTTLAHALAAHLGGVGMNTPGDALRPVTPGILAGLGDHQTARALFYASSVLAQGREARRLVDAGTTVVMDRYWLSTISFERARGVIASLCDVESLVEPPDLTLVLSLDESERQWRLHERGFSAANRENLDPTFRDRVWRGLHLPSPGVRLQPTHTIDLTGLGRARCIEAVLGVVQAGPRRGAKF